MRFGGGRALAARGDGVLGEPAFLMQNGDFGCETRFFSCKTGAFSGAARCGVKITGFAAFCGEMIGFLRFLKKMNVGKNDVSV